MICGFGLLLTHTENYFNFLLISVFNRDINIGCYLLTSNVFFHSKIDSIMQLTKTDSTYHSLVLVSEITQRI